jgi:hypothetical protein
MCEREEKYLSKSWAKMNPSTLCTFVDFATIKKFKFS